MGGGNIEKTTLASNMDEIQVLSLSILIVRATAYTQSRYRLVHNALYSRTRKVWEYRKPGSHCNLLHDLTVKLCTIVTKLQHCVLM
jgi:hypothetical protein